MNGQLNYSVLFSGVEVDEGASAEYSVLMKNVRIGKNAKVRYAILADDVIVEDGAIIGDSPEQYPNRDEWGIAVVGQGAVIKSEQIVLPKQMISAVEK